MSEEKTTPGLRAHLSILLPVLWLATGASFKLFAGTPKDLPPILFDLGLGIDLVPAKPERLRQVQFQQPMMADDLEGDLLAR